MSSASVDKSTTVLHDKLAAAVFIPAYLIVSSLASPAQLFFFLGEGEESGLGALASTTCDAHVLSQK